MQIGFAQGKAFPCTFYNKGRPIRTFVHGDDYVSTGKPEQLQRLREQFEKNFQVKTQLLGLGKDHVRQVKILNMIATWKDNRGKL